MNYPVDRISWASAVVAVRRLWPWATSATWGAGAAALLTVAWFGTDPRAVGGLVAAISNGLLLFCIVGGVGVADNARERGNPSATWVAVHPWRMAFIPAAASLVTLLPMRLVAVSRGLDGPWDALGESAFDIAFRTGVVYVVVGAVAWFIAREQPTR